MLIIRRSHRSNLTKFTTSSRRDKEKCQAKIPNFNKKITVVNKEEANHIRKTCKLKIHHDIRIQNLYLREGYVFHINQLDVLEDFIGFSSRSLKQYTNNNTSTANLSFIQIYEPKYIVSYWNTMYFNFILFFYR